MVSTLRPSMLRKFCSIRSRLKGTSYLDILHVWGILRAGFIPQLISLRMTNPTVVYELLDRAKAVALIHEPEFSSYLEESPGPVFLAGDVLPNDNKDQYLPKTWTPSTADDISMILHTSGSSSGSPKLVPYTSKWVDFAFQKLKQVLSRNKPQENQEVITLG